MFQWLVGNWVKQQVQRRVYETVMNSAQEQMRAAAGEKTREPSDDEHRADSPADDAGDRCDVALVFAMAAEMHGLADRVAAPIRTSAAGLAFLTGRAAGRRLALVEAGVGRQAAARATEALIDGHQPAWVISAGFAGSLDQRVRRHDFVMATELVDLDGQTLSLDLHVPQSEAAERRNLHVGRLLTVDRIILDPAEKRSLGERTGALAVDMETFAVAEVCRRRRVRFMAVRVISDGIDERLPKEIERLAQPQSAVRRAGLALGSLTRRPSAAKDYWRLWRDGLEASDWLARFLEGLLAQLPRQIEQEHSP